MCSYEKNFPVRPIFLSKKYCHFVIFENFVPNQTLFSPLKIAIFWCIAPINFLIKSLIWHILCVDKIGSADRGILCVDKIGSPEIPQDPCSRLKCWGLIRRDCLPARIRGWAGTATGPHSHVVHISHTPTERAHTDPKKISFGKKLKCSENAEKWRLGRKNRRWYSR